MKVVPAFLKYSDKLTRAVLNKLPVALLFALLLGASCKRNTQTDDTLLTANWTLAADTLMQSLAVQLPADVHTSLLADSLIDDPLEGTNESGLQWIDKQQWVFSTRFETKKEWLHQTHVELVFEGIDTYAWVYLNDSLLFFADNMFRSWRKDIKSLLAKQENYLRVVFPPIDSIQRIKLEATGVELPERRAFTRKAAYQSGWDWSPVYRTVGLWKPVRVISWQEVLFEDAAVETLKIGAGAADLNLRLDMQSETRRALKLQLLHNGRKLIETPVQLQLGNNRLSVPFQLTNPRLWWPNGYGKQDMYTFEIKLFDGNREVVQRFVKAGIRTIELEQNEDADGRNFAFLVNGKKIYARGANYVPEDNFPVNTSIQRSRRLLIEAADVHMNMLRVWGGGYYPPDYFYELCDSLGLLVWQDFMFANSLYPADSAFLANVTAEATAQLTRLRKHPSLALWCGNNEIDEGMKNWGWQKQFGWTSKQQSQLEKDYDFLFNQLLKELVQAYHPTTAYWPTSPSTGWGHAESLLTGDVHYWGVWWGEEPFEAYQAKVGRFNSEFGFQALPDLHTLKKMATDSLWLASEALKTHQKHPRGMQLIDAYMQRDFPVPTDFASYVYVSQLVQAYGVGMAVEAQRMSKPKSMGTLYWQLNDSWPAISWSSVDYFGRRKALHFKLKELFADIFIGAQQLKDGTLIKVDNESGDALNGQLQVDIMNFRGDLLHAVSNTIELQPGSSQAVHVSVAKFLHNVGPQHLMMRILFRKGNSVLAEKHHFFTSPGLLQLPPAQIKMHLMPKNDRIQISLTADVFVKDLQLSCDDENGRFSNNYFDILAGKTVSIDFYPSAGVDAESLRFHMKCLNDISHQ